MSDHSPFGPSTIWRRAYCPGSYREEQGLPDLPSEHADHGTRLHDVVASGIRNKKLNLKDLSEEDRDLVLACRDFYKETFDNTLNMIGVSDPDRIKVSVERRLDLVLPGIEPIWGTADVVLIPLADPGMQYEGAVIIDWKFGYLELDERAIAWQMAGYALGAMRVENKTQCACYIYGARTGEVHEFVITKEMIPRIQQSIVDVVKRSKGERALCLGPWCRYCTANGICGATVEKARELVGHFDVPQAVTQKGIENAIEEQAAKLPAEKLKPLLEIASTVEAAVKAVKQRAKDILIQQSDAIPGWTVYDRAVSIRINPQEACEKGLITRNELESLLKGLTVTDSRLRDLWKAEGRTNAKELKADIEAKFGRYPTTKVLKRGK